MFRGKCRGASQHRDSRGAGRHPSTESKLATIRRRKQFVCWRKQFVCRRREFHRRAADNGRQPVTLQSGAAGTGLQSRADFQSRSTHQFRTAFYAGTTGPGEPRRSRFSADARSSDYARRDAARNQCRCRSDQPGLIHPAPSPACAGGRIAGGRIAGSGQPVGQQIGGGIAGVASKSESPAIMVYNDHTNYNEWEFVFDLTKQKPVQNPNTGSIGNTGREPGIHAGRPRLSRHTHFAKFAGIRHAGRTHASCESGRWRSRP